MSNSKDNVQHTFSCRDTLSNVESVDLNDGFGVDGFRGVESVEIGA